VRQLVDVLGDAERQGNEMTVHVVVVLLDGDTSEMAPGYGKWANLLTTALMKEIKKRLGDYSVAGDQLARRCHVAPSDHFVGL
jgi:hypothetical protein